MEYIFKENIKIIRKSYISGNKEIDKIVLPTTNPLTIGTRAFENCVNLKEITLSENINFIGNKVFFNCISLEKVNFKANVKEISNSMFYNCISLKKIVIPEGIEKINKCAFYKCANLEEVILPNSLKEIEDGAFMMCPSLKEIMLPRNVKISSIVFDCSLKNIYVTAETFDNLSDLVKSIHKNSFKNYPTLDELLDKGKSFKEISSILKNQDLNR